MRVGRLGWVFVALLCGTPLSVNAGTFSITTPDSAKAARGRGAEYWRTARDIDSYGLLQAASLIGLDHEHLFAPRVGAQFGFGLLGADLGLTFHFSPGIRNNHLYVGYWNIGLTEGTFVGGAAVVSYVMRTPGLFTMQLGLGVPVVEGNTSREFNDTDVLVLASVGICPR